MVEVSIFLVELPIKRIGLRCMEDILDILDCEVLDSITDEN
jgi:hypothetical protein